MVKEASQSAVKCRVEAGETTQFDANIKGQFVSGTGVNFQYFNLMNTWLNYSDPFRTKFINEPSYFSDKVLNTGKMSELEALQLKAYTGHFVSGYFKAPVSSSAYKFYISADDTADFYFSTKPSNNSRS